MKRLLGLLAATALAAGAVPAAAQASGSSGTPSNSLFDTVAASLSDNGGSATDKNWYDFDILANAVVALGLDGALKDDGPGGTGLDSATVFGPNDRAFQQLVADITNTPFWKLSEADTLQALLDVAGVADLNGSGVSGATALTQTVLYHVSGENIMNLRKRAFGPDITTVNTVGSTKIDPVFVPFVRWVSLRDGDKNDGNPLWYGRTIGASNGTIQVISGVLRPLDLDALFPADD
jgi:uncharacterized surface protein with fasciclin (FAS1) repeats